MDLRELKREVENLPEIGESLQKIQNQWLQPLTRILKNLDQKEKQELLPQLTLLQSSLQQLQASQVLNQKLRQHSRHLIELKLSQFQEEKQKAKLLAQCFLKDDYLNFNQTLQEIKSFEENISRFSQHYHQISQELPSLLPLEERVFLLGSSTLHQLQKLQTTAQQQQQLATQLGKHFISLVRQIKNTQKSK